MGYVPPRVTDRSIVIDAPHFKGERHPKQKEDWLGDAWLKEPRGHLAEVCTEQNAQGWEVIQENKWLQNKYEDQSKYAAIPK